VAGLRRERRLRDAHRLVRGPARGRLDRSGGVLWKKLLEVLEQIRRGLKKGSDLVINILDRLLLSLIGLQDLKELFVRLRVVVKSSLAELVSLS
jgi:hypothetical protein